MIATVPESKSRFQILPAELHLPSISVRMAFDAEKGDAEVSQDVPRETHNPTEHQGFSTASGPISSHSQSSQDTIDAVPEQTEPAQRSKSRSSSTRSRTLSIIPRSKRRGLLARFTLIPEVARPYDYKQSTKWLITLQVALAAAAAPMGSAIILRVYPTSQSKYMFQILTSYSRTSTAISRPPCYSNNH